MSKLSNPMPSAAALGTPLAGPAGDRVASAFAAWNAAFNKGDAKAVAAFYAADAVVLPASHEIVKGPADIEKFWAGLISSHVTGHVLEPFKIVEAGDALIAASKWSANGRDDKGNKTSFGGIATHVLQKQTDKSYKLVLHTFN
ncbi:MAG: DUF4440 domain-containing protein [Burkholderiaceae bacterium]